MCSSDLFKFELNCAVQTILTNDPPLKAVHSRSAELGARGQVGRGYNWNVSAYRTILANDILFDLDAISFHTHFFNAERTRREGLEIGFGGEFERLQFQSSFSLTSATYQSEFITGNISNSSSKCSGDNCTFLVRPGDRMPSIPLRGWKLDASYQVDARWSMGMNVTGQSGVILRGNENNAHEVSVRTDRGGAGLNTYLDPGRTAGFAVMNANVNWTPSRTWTVFAKINNLLDKRYYTAGQLRSNPFSPTDTGFVDSNGWNYSRPDWTNVANLAPGAPRALWVGVRYALGSQAKQHNDKN